MRRSDGREAPSYFRSGLLLGEREYGGAVRMLATPNGRLEQFWSLSE